MRTYDKFRYGKQMIGFRTCLKLHNKLIFESVKYDQAFKNTYFSAEMFSDYFNNAKKCSNISKTSFFNSRSIRYNIYTDYNRLLPEINKKLKYICKYAGLHYKPYELYLVNYNKHDGFFQCYYHLHNSSDDLEEFYNDQTLEILFGKLDRYIQSLMPEKIEIKNRKLTDLDIKRNIEIDNEIERSYNYIETLKSLKK